MWSAVFILLENQFAVGDVVSINGSAGTVEKVTLRRTVLREGQRPQHYKWLHIKREEHDSRLGWWSLTFPWPMELTPPSHDGCQYGWREDVRG